MISSGPVICGFTQPEKLSSVGFQPPRNKRKQLFFFSDNTGRAVGLSMQGEMLI